MPESIPRATSPSVSSHLLRSCAEAEQSAGQEWTSARTPHIDVAYMKLTFWPLGRGGGVVFNLDTFNPRNQVHPFPNSTLSRRHVVNLRWEGYLAPHGVIR
jgi:hypothetical protein